MSITEEQIAEQQKLSESAVQAPLQVFYPASVIIFVASAVALVLSYGKHESSVSISLAGIVLSMCFLVAPAFIQYRTDVLRSYLRALDETEHRLFDVDAIRREHRKTIMKLEELMEKTAAQAEQIASLTPGAAALKEKNEELSELRQAAAKERQLQEGWADSMMEYCTFLNRTVNLPGLSPEYARAVKKSSDVLVTHLAALGLDVIAPRPGERFDDRLHKAEDFETGEEGIEPGSVARCLSFGYRTGPKVLQKAVVHIAEDRNAKG